MGEIYDSHFYDNQAGGSLRAAEKIVPIVLSIVSADTVVDVGCGIGTWLNVFKRHGVREVLGIDGDYVNRSQLKISPSEFLSRDLEFPLVIDKRFALAVSLEVGEHLSQGRAATFVRELSRLADVVLFSAAIPFQSGVGHLNEKWQAHWESHFQDCGYTTCDVLRPIIWDVEDIPVWYRQNTLFFANEAGRRTWPKLVESRSIISAVHPELYLEYANPSRLDLRRIGLKRILGKLPALVWNSVIGRIRG